MQLIGICFCHVLEVKVEVSADETKLSIDVQINISTTIVH